MPQLKTTFHQIAEVRSLYGSFHTETHDVYQYPHSVGCLTTAWFIIESEIHLRQDQNSHPLRSPVFHFLRPNQDYGRRMRVSCEGFYSSLSFSCWLVTYIIGRALTLKKIDVIFRPITHGEPAFTSYTVCFFYWLSVPSKCRSGTRLPF